MALSGSGKRRISPQLHARTCGQARRPLRHPGGGHSGRLHPVSAPGRRRLPPQIPGGKRLEPSAACRPCKGQPDKHPLLGKRTKDHQSEVLLPSGGKPWFRFSIYASHVRYGNFSLGKRTFPYHAYPIARRGIIHTNTKAVCTAANDDDLAAYGRLSIYPPNKLILKFE